MTENPDKSSNSDKSSFVVVANRLAVDRVTDEAGNESWRTSPGGLVTALEPVMRQQEGAWVGWAGQTEEEIAPFDHDGMHLVPVRLTDDEVELYYEGFSNGTLWPLYHDSVAFPHYHRHWWQAYREVNRKFAAAAAEAAAPDATVWVQDYQLQLVPQYLRELRPDLTIGFFLHIPFPPHELFSQLPWRTEIVTGLLGADLIGFQTPGGATNFLRLVRRYLKRPTKGDIIGLPDGRYARARAYPISIDAQGFADLAASDEAVEFAANFREELGNPKRIFLGVDRLDYTKGLRHRIRAFGELFDSGDLDPAEDVFVQVASPSREDVEEYIKLRDEIELMVGRINGDASVIGRPPIVYLHSSYPRVAMAAMYSVADVMVVTPLRDGMNLVCKEYVACRPDASGALVLSEFAGAATELKQAYMVNPYDLDGMKATILNARNAKPQELRRRMTGLQKQVFENDIDRWANRFLTDLAGTDE
ncbi:MAG: alpha,alpha-trehalose-phosphate synthase (UDP-forming) [Brooklawnia sp.]|jgi:trehalose 6-phosphate synthase